MITNLLAAVLVTLVTNITSVQVPDYTGTVSGWVSKPVSERAESHPLTGSPAYPLTPFTPPTIRVETTEILETSTITFEWEGIPHVMPFHNRVISRTVRKFRTKQIEEELK